jgi:putative heme-binding domain-containing protein
VIRNLCGLFIICCGCLPCGQVAAQSLSQQLLAEGSAALAKAAREKGSSIRGAILFPQKKLNCASCHAPGARDQGPDLTQIGKDVDDAYFVDSILQPSKTIKKGYESVNVLTTDGKVVVGRIVSDKGAEVVLSDPLKANRLIRLPRDEIDRITANEKSTMPEGLADQLENRQQFLDLVKYLMDIAATGKPAAQPPQSLGGGKVDQRIQGLALLDEFNCTSCHRTDEPGLLPSKQGAHLAGLTERIDPQYIQRYLADPHKVKPGTRMPGMQSNLSADLSRQTAEVITHYLVSLSDQPFQRQPLDAEAATRGQEAFHSVGCVACHSPRNEQGAELFPETSVPLGNVREKYNLDGLSRFLEDPHAVRPSGRMPNMKLTHWEAIDIANYLLAGAKAETEPFKLDVSMAAAGKQFFLSVNCGECHRQQPKREQEFPALAELRVDEGCLSLKSGKWPRYDLSDAQRAAMTTAIKQHRQPLGDRQQIAVTMETLRCFACHQRDDLGGVSDERDIYFHTTNENLGPQGRIPPTLTGVGAKLKPEWMRQVLVSGRSIRPYMLTRMPQYGTENVAHLVELFGRTDQQPAVQYGHFDDEKEASKVGTELVGNGGLNCIACHTFQLKPAQTMPGVDLTEMAQRLQKDWFYRYMQSPQSLSPNTVMPTFWPGGTAIRKDILDGDMHAQIEAIWLYLQDGRQARTPRGLIREPIELLATDRAVMLRRSYQGIGKRGIGVGYPGAVNLAYDAEQLRIGMIWKGKFAEPSGVWRGQGSGTVRPLGSDLIRFPPGPELDDAVSPWVVDEGRPPNHQFTGYYLDDMDRPTFTYRFGDVEVEDYCIDLPGEPSTLKRTLTFTTAGKRDGLVFRAGAADKITPQGDHTFLLGDALRIRSDPAHEARVVDAGDGKQLVLDLKLPAGKTKLTLQYSW